jgi:anti-anti-sigma regulatory factor
MMACNFKILSHQNSESIHLNLRGDFDGSSAHELLNTLKTYSRNGNRVFIHTDGLRDVHPFGKAIFQKNFSEVEKRSGGFIFTGEKLAP